MIAPSVSPEPAEENATLSSSVMVSGVPPAAAVGAWFATTTMSVTVAVSVASSSSVTVNVAL